MEVYGGPHDGAHVTTRLTADFVWTDGKRCFSKPRAKLSLYRRVKQVEGGHKLIYVQNAYVLCPDCGAYSAKASDACALCGASLHQRA